jgi:ribosomal protein L19
MYSNIDFNLECEDLRYQQFSLSRQFRYGSNIVVEVLNLNKNSVDSISNIPATFSRKVVRGQIIRIRNRGVRSSLTIQIILANGVRVKWTFYPYSQLFRVWHASQNV